MQQALKSESSVDRWAAAQCLAHDGLCNSLVVGEIVQQLLETEDTIKHEKAIYLLGKLSIFSVSTYTLYIDQLSYIKQERNLKFINSKIYLYRICLFSSRWSIVWWLNS